MAKLHEILAVESDVESVAKKTIHEATKTFREKGAFFFKQVKTTKMFDENAQPIPDEKQEMTTTVQDKLDYVAEHIIKYLDIIAQKERTNQIAVADLVVDGKILVEKVPATLLLGLESRLKLIRDMYSEIPTLPHGGKWLPAPDEGDNIYYNENMDVRLKTAKTFNHKVLYEATQHHPAQIEKWEETVNVGQIEIQIWSGLITPKQKSDLLKKIDTLLMAVKQARQRANSVNVENFHIGKILMDYIHG